MNSHKNLYCKNDKLTPISSPFNHRITKQQQQLSNYLHDSLFHGCQLFFCNLFCPFHNWWSSSGPCAQNWCFGNGHVTHRWTCRSTCLLWRLWVPKLVVSGSPSEPRGSRLVELCHEFCSRDVPLSGGVWRRCTGGRPQCSSLVTLKHKWLHLELASGQRLLIYK